jgi:transposase, IS5 family
MVNGYFFVLPPMEMEKFPSKRVAPALTVRMALEAIIIKEKLGLTDIETVEMI